MSLRRLVMRVGMALAAGIAAPIAASAAGAAFQLPPVPTSGFDARDGAARRVDRIEFHGNRSLRTSALQAASVAYLGRDLTAVDIEELRVALTHEYTDRGFINSGLVLDSHAPYRDGVLSFLVIEGAITEVRVHGVRGLRTAYVEDRLRGEGGEALNTNVLRARFQRLLDDPLFARINSRIQPGANPGEAILDVDVKRARPYSFAFALNNYRPPSIGSRAYELSAQLRDLTGLGDTVDLGITGPLKFSGGIGFNIGFRLPVSRHGTEISLSAAKTNTVVTEDPLSALHIRSTVERQELKLTQPLWRAADQQLSASASIARERNSTTLDDSAFSFLPGANDGVTRSVTARVYVDYSYRSEHQYLGARLTVLHANLLGYHEGTVDYARPDQKYFVWIGQLHHLLQFAPWPFELESRATLQRTHSVVSDLHALELGGVGSVRGFRENEVLRSNVGNFNADLRWRAFSGDGSYRPSLAFGVFFDWGAGHNAGQTTDTFSSWGVTLRGRWTHAQADLSVGEPLIRPGSVAEQHSDWQDHGIHLQLLTTF